MKSRRHVFISALLLLASASTLRVMWGCEGNLSGNRLIRGGINSADDGKAIDDPTGSGKSYFEETWTQPSKGPGKIPVDISIFRDTSGSMNEEVSALGNALTEFVDQLVDSGIDARFAVFTGLITGPVEGRIISASGDDDRVLWLSKYPDKATFLSKLTANLKMNVGSSYLNQGDAPRFISDGGEFIFKGIQSAITTRLAENMAAGIFRQNAAQVFMQISDEDEPGAESPFLPNPSGSCINQADFCPVLQALNLPGFSPAPKGSVAEIENCCYENHGSAKFYRDAQGNLVLSARALYQQLKQFTGTLLLYTPAIVYPEVGFPNGGENGPGWGYFELADRSGAPTIDLSLATLAGGTPANTTAQEAFNAELNKIPDLLAQGAAIYTAFDLKYKPCPDTVTLSLDGVTVDNDKLTLDLDNGTYRVSIPFLPENKPGTVVSISYQIDDGGSC